MLEGIGDLLGGIGDFATDVIGQVADIQEAYDQMRGHDQSTNTAAVATQQPTQDAALDDDDDVVNSSDYLAQPNWYLLAAGAGILLVAIVLAKK